MVFLHLLKDYGVIKAGSVERFHPEIAKRLLAEGIAERESDMLKRMSQSPVDKQVKAAPRRK
jgi:hypothetical protein